MRIKNLQLRAKVVVDGFLSGMPKSPIHGLTIETRLGYLRSRGHDIAVIRILDPAEVDFPFEAESLFYDLETGRELYVDPEAVRRGYRERFLEHAGAMARACHRLGADIYEVT